MINQEKKIQYFFKELHQLEKEGTCVVEFSEGVGVILDYDGCYYSYFTNDGNVTCNGLCIQRHCVYLEGPITFKFIDPLETARFIVLNMLPRMNKSTYLLWK